MTLQEEIARHASLLCERELDRRQGVVRSPAVGEAVHAVALQVARGIADAAANDDAVRCALESIYAGATRGPAPADGDADESRLNCGHIRGRPGFDVVDSPAELQVEVPEAS